MEDVQRWLIESGLTERASEYLIEAAEVLGVAALAFIANKITRSVILRLVDQVAKRTSTDWDDIIVKRRVFHRLAHLAPAIVIYMMAPLVVTTPQLTVLFERAALVYMLLAGLLVMDAILTSVNDIYESFDVARRIPILGYLQVVKIVISIMVAIFAISIVIDKSVVVLFTGLGALTAIILLIFKDSILGLVAGIQLVANDMVRPGDWIEMPKYGADGDVIQITLNTVKIRNWDKTVTTIPTYSLISDSFKNWRGMSESGGRRIKRALPIDMTSVKFCTPEMIDRFSRIGMLRDHIERKTKELREYNERNEIDQSVPVNGRRMTNLGTFRAYLVAYLRAHPKIHQDMTFLVRQLPPSDKGLPLEIYVFSNDQVWANYEAIQADIFDHLLASLPEFELRPFQSPTGDDVRNSIFAAAG
ncbi:MAG TPA: mechanosensitive ion channel family protein [Bryobacterales bacterium]|nr:mechanosensitive ion channel family protein [Bryobacterales bacterium]